MSDTKLTKSYAEFQATVANIRAQMAAGKTDLIYFNASLAAGILLSEGYGAAAAAVAVLAEKEMPGSMAAYIGYDPSFDTQQSGQSGEK